MADQSPSEENVELGIFEDTKHPDYQVCLNTVEKTIKSNEKVQKLVDAIEALGCEIPKSFIACRKCVGPMTGGFISSDPQSKEPYVPQIIVCQNQIKDSITFQTTIAHELIHAYDACRSKLDISKCEQHACTELTKGLPECAKRRATLSLQANPVCRGVAAQAVEQAFEKCFNDLAPFDKNDILKG